MFHSWCGPPLRFAAVARRPCNFVWHLRYQSTLMPRCVTRFRNKFRHSTSSEPAWRNGTGQSWARLVLDLFGGRADVDTSLRADVETFWLLLRSGRSSKQHALTARWFIGNSRGYSRIPNACCESAQSTPDQISQALALARGEELLATTQARSTTGAPNLASY